MLSASECATVAEFLQGLSNPVRVKILCFLREGERSVSEIIAEVGEKQSNVSHQLQILLAKGYLSRRREERNVYYAIKDQRLLQVMEGIRQLVLEQREPG